MESIFGVKVSFTQVASVLEGSSEMIAFDMLLQVFTPVAFELTNGALVHFEATLIIGQFGDILIEVTPGVQFPFLDRGFHFFNLLGNSITFLRFVHSIDVTVMGRLT